MENEGLRILRNQDPKEQEILYHTRSEEVQEIMGRIPSWITRWGITVLAFIIAGFFLGCYFFKYPDIIPARVTIYSSNPPVEIVSRSNLPIQRILVQNNQPVKEGDILCVLSNTARLEDVETTYQLCQAIDTVTNLRSFCNDVRPDSHFNLGELQSSYISLCQAIQEYQFFLHHNSYHMKLSQLDEQSGYQEQLSAELEKNQQKMHEQLNMQRNRFAADSELVADLVMSKVEYENTKRDLIGQQISTTSTYTTILQSKLQEKEILKNIAETSIQLQTEEYNLQQKIREAAKAFNGAFRQWDQNYVLRTPVSGNVTFFRYWKENQFVKAGERVMAVVPPIQQYIARGEIGVNGAGKTKPGQPVLIKLLAYPYEEFGSLSGRLISRSSLSMDSTFSIQINLSDGLTTNAMKKIPDQPRLEGLAEIQTENKSILERLFEQVYGKTRR